MLSVLTEVLSVSLGLLGTFLFARKHWSAPLCMVFAYSFALVFNAIHGHVFTGIFTVIKIILSSRTLYIWIKE